MKQYIPLSVEFDGIAEVIETLCGVSVETKETDLLNGIPHPPVKQYRALWDTGASHSAISTRIVSELGLIPEAMANNYTAAGIIQVMMYCVNIVLPNNVVLPSMLVSCCELDDIDMLIGMDVIGKGDFAITNVGRKTTFSFRVPSVETIDFVKEQNKLT